MKKYMKPTMNGQVFATNEYIGACGDISKFSCLNMNNISGGSIQVYYDNNPTNGILDDAEKQTNNRFTDWGEMNDCGTNGMVGAGAHDIQSLDGLTRVIVKYPDGSTRYEQTEIAAVIHYQKSSYGSGYISNSPHFVSLKNINHS